MWAAGLLIFAAISLAVSQNSTYVEVSLNSVMTLGWLFFDDSIELTFKVRSPQCRVQGYCSIGFGGSMTNCDMVAVFAQGDKLVLLDLWSQDHGTPREDTALGGSQDYTVSHWDSTSGNLTVVLARKLNTGDALDFALSRDLQMSICWGYLEKPQFTLHSAFGSGLIRWGLTPATVTYKDQSGSSLDTHKSLMAFLWLFVIQVAIVAARYFKTFSRWFALHATLGTVVIVASCVSMTSMFSEDRLADYPQDTLVHSRLGMAMMALLAGVGLLGAVARTFGMLTEHTQVFFAARRAHQVLGYALVCIGFSACWYGEKIGAPQNPPGEIISFVMWVALFSFADFLHRLGLPALKGCCRRRTLMTHAEVLEKVTAQGKKWAFYDQYVLDLTHFTNPHPGGAFMIKQTYGEDYGKYLTGTSGFGSATSGYAHSATAFLYAQRLVIGKLKPSPFYKAASPGYKWSGWQLEASQEVATNTRLLSFKSPHFAVTEKPASLECAGQHFCVRAFLRGAWVLRYYSISFALSAAKAGLTAGSLHLVVKSYPPHGKMSTYLCNLQKGDDVELKGPLGPGLALTPNLEGLCVAIGAGTGVMPFLDLVQLLQQNELPKVRLFLYCGFRAKTDNFAAAFLESTGNAQLRVVLAYDENKEDKLSAEMLKRHLADEPVARAWVCGPAGFNKFALETLLQVGVERRAVMLM